ncbi:MAG: carbohydrate ABC transporter substrate-binding protein [Cyanobacteria bacterium SBLK]|nr:carbohydrate ABC transporter substrate-binding protein [Cyanobacteria bacterium SBLK]
MKIRVISILLFLFGLGAGLTSCSVFEVQFQNDSAIANLEADDRASEEDSLVIRWPQSYVTGADDVLVRLVREWEKSSGIKTTLLLKPEPLDEVVYKRIEQGRSADIILFIGESIVSKLAWEGKLLDVSDVINPIRDSFNPAALNSINYLNKTRNQRSFYAIPTGITTYNIHYWKPYLDRLGLKASDIPQDWHGFWQFWQEVRDRLHQLGETGITSFCLTLNKDDGDGQDTLLHFLHGHNVNIFDNEGRSIVDRQENRQGLINALSQLSDLYRDGYIPPSSMEWTGAGNNFQFLDRQCLLVSNTSLSIPATQKLPDSPYTKNEKNRYLNEIVTLSPWPNTVNGSPFKVFVEFPLLIVPAHTQHQEAAKKFLAYLLQPKNLQVLIEQERGRVLPPIKELSNTSFWQDANDPHFDAVRVVSEQIQPYPTTNPASAETIEQKILTTALERVIRDGISPEEAADEAIVRIQKIVNRYNQ